MSYEVLKLTYFWCSDGGGVHLTDGHGNARLGVTPGEHHIVDLKNEVIEPPTTAIIMRYLGSLVNKGLRSICTI
jgi:hypothetical protein